MPAGSETIVPVPAPSIVTLNGTGAMHEPWAHRSTPAHAMLGPQWKQTSPPVTPQVFIADVPSHMVAPSTQSSWQSRPQVPPPQIGWSAGHAIGALQVGQRSAPALQVSTLLPLHPCAP